MRFILENHGCRANQADGEGLAQALEVRGGIRSGDADPAGFAVVNGCAITHRAVADTRAAVRRHHREGRRDIVTGCVANAEATALAGMDGVELVLGTEHRDHLPELLEARVRRDAPRLVAADTLTRRRPEATGTFALPRHRARAFVKIQDGCNFRCAFCIVPSVRGRSRSVPLDEVVRRVREAEAAGFAEVVLTGIHIGTWGWDVGHREGLPRLVTAVLASTSDVRVRLGTLDPQEVSDSLVDVFAAEDRICPHLHLGLQSGSPRVLRRMRRGHTVTGLEPALAHCVVVGPASW